MKFQEGGWPSACTLPSSLGETPIKSCTVQIPIRQIRRWLMSCSIAFWDNIKISLIERNEKTDKILEGVDE